jgi:hypothetical protein
MAQGQGNFGNTEQHRKAGSMSSGNTGNPAQHSEAGKKGGKARAKTRSTQTGQSTTGS